MIEQPTPELWAKLRTIRPTTEDTVETCEVQYDGTPTGILMGMDVQSDLHLLIPVHAGPGGREPTDLNGLKVRHRFLQSGQFLCLIATAPHEPVFTPFCRQVVEAIHVQRREPWAAVASLIRQWQIAWRPGRQHMSKAVQVGLAGELYILNRIMIPTLGSRAVQQWSGPEKERHDFVSGGIHLEVKTTRGSRHEHEISRLDQLWVPQGRRLLLASVQLEESIGGVETLESLIQKIGEQIRSDAGAVDDFMSKLFRLDWDDEMCRSGELMRFHVRDASLYEVDEEFPRLTEDFQPPTGIVSVRYTISLANLPTLDVGEATQMILEANTVSGGTGGI